VLGAGRLFAWVAAICLFVAATWFALIDKNISVQYFLPLFDW